MNTLYRTNAHRALSLALAILFTAGMLGGVNGLAQSAPGAAAASQTQALGPAAAPRG